MKQPNDRYKIILQKLATAIQTDLSSKVFDQRVVPIPKPKIEVSNTFGWYVQIFSLKKIRGSVEFWIDLFPNIDRPILSLCYWCSDLDRIKKIANHSITNYRDDHPHKLGKRYRGNRVLETPLAKKYFERFLIEPYGRKFFTYYFTVNLSSGVNESLKKRLSKKTEWLLRSTLSALEIKSNESEIYPAIENREIVAQHIRRERSKQLADAIKLRDSFTCRVCDFNFLDTYGEVGRGFAEAHHRIALAKLRKNVKTKPEDLITVCSNCHRMLHRMDGLENDFKTLRKRIRK